MFDPSIPPQTSPSLPLAFSGDVPFFFSHQPFRTSACRKPVSDPPSKKRRPSVPFSHRRPKRKRPSVPFSHRRPKRKRPSVPFSHRRPKRKRPSVPFFSWLSVPFLKRKRPSVPFSHGVRPLLKMETSLAGYGSVPSTLREVSSFHCAAAATAARPSAES
ncbi:hypothetical protein EV702DRAFT_1204348 [Suillus placidus]|uniref:Uncharacterized protein n=1 Tax=Suillus placidus TaxID=48579 RepID=A0A9P6ZH13_9AGAM|nr:hypothetical protein EV702DRAFT_1204348 [Suillus placidus]